MPTVAAPRRQPSAHARDPQRTRDRTLAAGLAECSAHGFAGARVARIARRARVNKRMLYHYFGNKEDLFRGIFDRKLVQRAAWLNEAPPRAAQPVIREDERRASFARALGDLRARQRRGLLPADLDAGHLLLAIM